MGFSFPFDYAMQFFFYNRQVILPGFWKKAQRDWQSILKEWKVKTENREYDTGNASLQIGPKTTRSTY